MPLLDLAGADTSGFEAMPSGVYDVDIYEAKMLQTQGGENAKLPAGTDFINVQFKITGGPADDEGNESGEEYKWFNRRAFTKLFIAPADYDKAKTAKMKGMIVRFLLNAGYTEEELNSDEFDLNLEDLVGRSMRIVLAQKPKYQGVDGEMDNEVKGTKPADDGASAPAGGLL